MLIKNNFLSVQKKARITWLKNEEQKSTKLLIALHGYGQLSTYFSRKFHSLPDLGFDVAVPEGLHRFYLAGSSGRVGASWMTKEERETDIQDNHDYIDQFIQSIENEYDEIILLGFSQGGATAARYYFENPEKINALILWASVFPPDIQLPSNTFPGDKVYFVLGKEDEYFTEEKQKEVLNLHEELGMRVISFDGKHDIDVTVLHTLLENS